MAPGVVAVADRGRARSRARTAASAKAAASARLAVGMLGFWRLALGAGAVGVAAALVIRRLRRGGKPS